MKKMIIYISIILFFSCSKEKENGNEESDVSFEVKEYISNAPIPGVSIQLRRCYKYDIEFGCQAVETFKIVMTNQNGIAKVSMGDYNRSNQGIQFSKAGYLTTEGTSGTTYLNREGWVNARLVPTKDYGEITSLVIYVRNDRFEYISLPYIRTPRSDTSLTIKAIAGQVNSFRWYVQGPGFNNSSGIVFASGEVANIDVPESGAGRVIIHF